MPALRISVEGGGYNLPYPGARVAEGPAATPWRYRPTTVRGGCAPPAWRYSRGRVEPDVDGQSQTTAN